jgi:hypothetical protein
MFQVGTDDADDDHHNIDNTNDNYTDNNHD